MKSSFIFLSVAIALCAGSPLPGQETQSPSAAVPPGFETLPLLKAGAILQPQYLRGSNFLVRDLVPAGAGANHFTIDSDFGVFEADGNDMLVRRIAEIQAIASLRAMSQTDEFKKAAAQAAKVPIKVAENLVNDPVDTLKSVPRGIVGFLKRTGTAVKEATDGRPSSPAEGNALENISGYSKTKRGLALKLGVDPYTTNEIFQRELSEVARPAFAGKFVVNLGMSAVGGGAGAALSVANVSNSLVEALRDKSPTDLRRMNHGLLTNGMGVADSVADAFLNNSAISPTAQTTIVGALAQLGNIPGQAEFILQAATSQDEHDALTFQQSVQIMANLNRSSPVARIDHLNGLTVCQTREGTVVVPIQWDYIAWTPLAERFVTALKAEKFPNPVTGYAVILTGAVSPMAAEALGARGFTVTPKALPGPLK